MSTTDKYLSDFYVSYVRADRPWAEWIAWCLEEANYQIILDIWNFRPGSNFILEMDDAIKSSKHTLLVMSPDYIASLYAQSGWTAAFAQQTKGVMGGVIPIIVRECTLDGLLGQIVPINISGLDELTAKNTLINKLSGRSIKPSDPPKYPGGRKRSKDQPPTFPVLNPLLNEYVEPNSKDNVVAELFKESFSIFSDAAQWTRGNKLDKHFLTIAAQKYKGQLEERHNTMRILGMSRPVPLRNIYTRVNILEKITARHRDNLEDMERFFDRDRRHFGKIRETKDGIEVINQVQKSIVLGRPGAGKTTFLKYITLQALDGQLIEKRIPIFIPVKEWGDSGRFLLPFLTDQFSVCGFPKATAFVERLLTSGSCLILFDGLDEVSSEVTDIIKQIRDFSNKYSTNKYIVSCRIAAYNYEFEHFTDLELADFSDDQIQSFISNWFVNDSKTAGQCWQKMSETPPIRELASTPLLLTLLCLAFDETLSFPPNKAELYKDSIDALLRRWDTSRRIKRVQLYQNFSVRRKETMFSQIAAETFQKGQYFLPQRTLEEYILNFIKHLPEVKASAVELDGEAILKSIEHQHGIFVERAKGIYSFSHLTFQEYFTGKYLVENAVQGTLTMLLDQHLTDSRWHEVILIVGGMLPKGDEFLISMKEHINGLANNRVNALLKSLQNKVEGREDFLARKKLPWGLARAYALYRAFEHIELDRKYGRAGNRSFDAVQSFTRDTFLELFRFLGIKPSHELTDFLDLDLDLTLNLDDKLAEPLLIYIKASHLLVRCLNSECYVTQETRDWLLDEFLKPPRLSRPSPYSKHGARILHKVRKWLYQ